jgi:cytochrome c553
LQWQLVFFRSGSRKNEIIQPMAETTQQRGRPQSRCLFCLADAAESFRTQRRQSGFIQEGCRGGRRRCASCHGDTFAGTKAVARLAGRREEYLLKAPHDYKSNVRLGGGVAAMADVAYSLSEEEITALAHYLAHL